MQKLMCFNAFLYQYIESFAFLEPGCKEGATPPPLNLLLCMMLQQDIAIAIGTGDKC